MRIPLPTEEPSSFSPSAVQPAVPGTSCTPTNVKIIVIGDASVGKTSLILRFCNEARWNDAVMTTGVDFRVQRLTVKGEDIKLIIWVSRQVSCVSLMRLELFSTRILLGQNVLDRSPLSITAQFKASFSVRSVYDCLGHLMTCDWKSTTSQIAKLLKPSRDGILKSRTSLVIQTQS